MFKNLKKKIAEEAAIAPRPGGATRLQRTISKESITSGGADSGDDFASDGSSSRDDLPSQISRRNEQIRRLEAKLTDYAEQIRNLQRMKEKLEVALEKHQDSSMRKLQEQNEAYHANRAKMAEELVSALEKKDQEWMAKLADLEEEKRQLSDQVISMKKQSISLFQKREDIDELEVFQQQEMAKIKHMAQSAASGCEKRLGEVQADYDSLRLEHQQIKSKMEEEAEEKEALINRLQEKVCSLERTLEESYSGEEGLQKLLKEKDAMEARLNETRQQQLEERKLHADSTSRLESELSKLRSQLEETQALLQQKDNELSDFKGQSSSQLKDLEQTLQSVSENLQQREEELNKREAQITSLQSQMETENSRLTQQLHGARQQLAEKVERFEAQILALEGARDFDRTAAQHKISQLEQDNEVLSGRSKEMEIALQKQEAEHDKMKVELSSRETVCVEIAKALEETRKQKEELQQQGANLTAAIEENTHVIAQLNEDLERKHKEMAALRGDYDSVVLQLQQLQSDLEHYKTRVTTSEESAEKHASAARMQLQEQKEALLARESQVSSLQEEVSALHDRLHSTDNLEPNGDVSVGDIAHLQKENREMEQQIAEKNKTIKQLQQRMAELKKTLQKELKIKPEHETNETREKQNTELATLPLTVTNNSDLNDSREINFEYLKHVVLKFMSATETEAFHLIKAVSVLLNFSVEEENLLKETLEYKMSWFGSKPSPKGTVRPSISKPRTPWS
uniref:Golgin subfamily A member 1 n=1 Tax=Leptobrachium leishanense TaxID=445787 RepID=A0A8C5QSP8_9ANUR